VKSGEEVVERRVVGRGARLKVDAEGGFGERVGGGICRELQPRTKEDQWEARAQISQPPRRGNNPRSSYRTHWRMAAHSLTRCVRCSVYMRNARTRFVLWPLSGVSLDAIGGSCNRLFGG
jgi:hypothetical protein